MTVPIPEIEAVVFDAVGTVMYPEPSVATVYQRAIGRHFGVELNVDTIRTVFASELSKRSQIADLSTSEAAEHDFWATVIRKLCPTTDGFDACFAELFEHFGCSASWRCFDDVSGALAVLQENTVKVAIASNFDQRLNPVCDGLEALSGVETRIISSLVGSRKPSPNFFAAVAATLDVSPAKVLMVGDDPLNDVAGAIEYGMEAALICRDSEVAQCPENAHLLNSLSKLPQLLGLQPTKSDRDHE